jgi:hypothetical protein
VLGMPDRTIARTAGFVVRGPFRKSSLVRSGWSTRGPVGSCQRMRQYRASVRGAADGRLQAETISIIPLLGGMLQRQQVVLVALRQGDKLAMSELAISFLCR